MRAGAGRALHGHIPDEQPVVANGTPLDPRLDNIATPRTVPATTR